jgi:translocator protein
MSELASRGQLRMSYVRWALLTVPGIVFFGFLSGRIANAGPGNVWFEALNKPGWMPPGWVFPVVWTSLYIMLGLAIAMVIDARGARARGVAIALFVVQFVANLAWSPLFFAAHQVVAAFILIVLMLVLAIATTLAFGRVRTVAAWLMVPYMVWLTLASMLNWQIHVLNPTAETLVPFRSGTHIDIS